MPSTVQQLPQLQSESTIQTYFTTFNQGDFAAAASLFTDEAEMHAPFEAPLVGQSAIQAYLEQEAAGMVANPQEVTCTELSSGLRRICVQGTAKALVFNVNVRWTFLLNPEDKIEQLEVKLLASLQELVTLRPSE
ncbi:MAG TPA: nuclear transport factor 2 family protein [Leptolyngbyaceae cyanobacterium]